MSVKNDFKSKKIGYETLFIFISGCIMDIMLHMFVNFTKNKNFIITKSLTPYYKSLEFGSGNTIKMLSSYFNGAIYGGVVCIIALLMMKLFMFAMEETNDPNTIY